MNVTVPAKPLLDALRHLKPLTCKVYSAPIMDCVYLEARDGGLLARRSNLTVDLSLSLFLENRVKEEGGVCVNLLALLWILQDIPAKDSVRLETVGKELIVGASGRTARLPLVDPDEYPLTSQFTGDRDIILDAAALRNALAKVLSTISTNYPRGPLTGLYLTIQGGILSLVASDTYRLSLATLEVPGVADGAWLLPGSGIKSLLPVLPKTGKVRLAVKDGPGPLLITTPNLECWISTMPESFVNYHQVIPKRTRPYFTLFAPDLARVVAVATTREGGYLILESPHPELVRVSRVEERATWEIPATVEVGTRVVLSAHYLADLCKAVGKTHLTLHKEGAGYVEVTYWTVADDPTWHYYLMPITLPKTMTEAAVEPAANQAVA